MTHEHGRREANKARTRTALLDAAYTLLDEEGPEALTAERVADAAGISRRTFFNYYASVDALVASGADDILDQVRRALSARPADEPLIDAGYAVVKDLFTVDLLTQAVRSWRAVESCPAARRFALEAHSDHVTGLAHEWARGRIDPGGTDSLRVAVLTAIVLTAFDEARRHWLAHHDHGEIDERSLADLLDCIRHAFEIIRPAYPPR